MESKKKKLSYLQAYGELGEGLKVANDRKFAFAARILQSWSEQTKQLTRSL
jgi:hypothetical protein